MALRERLRADARQRHAAGLNRTRRVQDTRHGMIADCDGVTLFNFCSNDYLGFAQHPTVISAFRAAAADYGVGSAGSALVSGYFSAHRALEEQAAALFGYDAALFVGSGYLANLGVLTALLDARALCVQDKRNHACLIDGARFSGAALKRYPHADLAAAEAALAGATQDLRLLVSDGVFSMDGDAADVAGLAQIAARHDATLMLDDAHGVGVLGATGLGSLQAAGLGAEDVPILVVPAGKALGGQGALILSNRDVIAHLVDAARPYLFSTAPAPAMAAALSQSLRLLATEPAHHAMLQANIRRFTALAAHAGLPLLPSNTAIQPLLAGGNDRAVRWSEALRARGFWVGAIRPPTVRAGTARLRITLTALHTPAQIEALVEALDALLKDDDGPAY
ncbi:MAG: 8-amino-7-oxononanoate synthase [Arenimonas sp.]|nr:8-amino-7-oxononanoate synthase [Arenimonas sp.]